MNIQFGNNSILQECQMQQSYGQSINQLVVDLLFINRKFTLTIYRSDTEKMIMSKFFLHLPYPIKILWKHK